MTGPQDAVEEEPRQPGCPRRDQRRGYYLACGWPILATPKADCHGGKDDEVGASSKVCQGVISC